MAAKKTPADWLNKYYPKPADEVGVRAALQHSLRKWRGLRVIGQYGISQKGSELLDADLSFVLEISSDSCALCQHHLDEDNNCPKCPLSLIRDRVPCDRARPGETETPWKSWVVDENPEPMIRWLEKAKEQESVLSTRKVQR